MAVNVGANMAYVWFEPCDDTYVDYGHEIEGGVAYPIRRATDGKVVGIFVQDLKAVMKRAVELEQDRRDVVAVGLLAQQDWDPGKLGLAATA